MSKFMSVLARVDLRAFDGDLHEVLAAASASGEGTATLVREIVAAVRQDGDAAVRRLTQRFDDTVLGELRVPGDELDRALGAATPEFRAALDFARERISAFHEAQVEHEI